MKFGIGSRFALLLSVPVLGLAWVGCGDDDDDPKPVGPVEHSLTMSQAALDVEWAVDRDSEVACAGDSIAGGLTVGDAIFSELGESHIEASAAWNVGNLLPSGQYTPDGPAGGPVAPVLEPSEYPHEFEYDARIGKCGSGLTATGTVRITAANGDIVDGTVQGGEAHRLDFLMPGDGVESFVEVNVTGGTGAYKNATGSFVMHTIVRFDPDLGHFVIDSAEMLPGGKLTF